MPKKDFVDYGPGLWTLMTLAEVRELQQLQITLPRRGAVPNLFYNFHFKIGDAVLMHLDAKGKQRIEQDQQTFLVRANFNKSWLLDQLLIGSMNTDRKSVV